MNPFQKLEHLCREAFILSATVQAALILQAAGYFLQFTQFTHRRI